MKPSRTPKQLANDARLRVRAKIRSDDLDGAKSEVNISAKGPLEVERRSIEVIPEAAFKGKAEDEAFMNEIVTVLIEAEENPDAPTFIQTGHNGIDQYIQRGIPQKIKRRFLYSLIAGKRSQFASNFGKDGSGKEFNKLTGRTSTTHRIALIDDTQRGRQKFAEWMQLPA